MLSNSRNDDAKSRLAQHRVALAFLLVFVPGIGTTEILWSGDFDDGNFLKWNVYDPDPIEIWGTPPYGRPKQYGGQHPGSVGNGDLMWLTADTDTGNFRAGPRLGKHSLGLHVKSYAGGSVDATSTDIGVVGDYDGSNTTRRRTELRGLSLHYQNNWVPYGETRWASASTFIPSDWDTKNGGGWMAIWQWKQNPARTSPPVNVTVTGEHWEFTLRRSSVENPLDNTHAQWSSLRFTPSQITSSPFYPDDAASVAMLSNLNKGGWTHFVIQLHFDGRTSTEGGVGFIKLWMRHNDGPWVQVVDYYPTPEYGVLFPQSGDRTNWGFQASLYMDNKQVLNLPGPGRTLYYDNLKIGSEKATFEMMSHDGSSPGMRQAPPEAPKAEVN